MKKSNKLFAVLLASVLIFMCLPMFPLEISAQLGSYYEPYSAVNVLVPGQVTFTIDAFEVNRRGQIFSEEHIVENLGNTDVFIDFYNIRLVFANNWEFESLTYPPQDFPSNVKSIHLVMNFGRFDIQPVVITDFSPESRYSILLKASQNGYFDGSSTLRLSFSGSVNIPSNTEWRFGDVNVMLEYTVRPVGSEQTPTQQGAQAPPPPLLPPPTPDFSWPQEGYITPTPAPLPTEPVWIEPLPTEPAWIEPLPTEPAWTEPPQAEYDDSGEFPEPEELPPEELPPEELPPESPEPPPDSF